MTYAFYSDSDADTATLELMGLWLHDPDDAAATVTQYPYGKDTRSTKIDTGGAVMVFAGRRYPVVDYGEHQDDQFTLTVQILHGETYRDGLESIRAFAEAKTTLVLRDNRGRNAYGVMSGYEEADQSWGSEVSFTFVRVDVEEVTA